MAKRRNVRVLLGRGAGIVARAGSGNSGHRRDRAHALSAKRIRYHDAGLAARRSAARSDRHHTTHHAFHEKAGGDGRQSADIAGAPRYFASVPKPAVTVAAHAVCGRQSYSITSSAVASRVGGTARPSIVAVWTFKTSSSLLDCATGKSASFAPLRMPPTLIPPVALHPRYKRRSS